MGAKMQQIDDKSHHRLEHERDIVQQYAKYADNFIKYSFNTAGIDMFNAINKLDKFALLSIHNRLSLDAKEIFFNLTKAIMKKMEDDDLLFSIIMELNRMRFTGVEMNGDHEEHKKLISKNCKVLNGLYQELARFILKPQCLNVKKELMDILQDFASALDRVDVRIESQKKSHNPDTWWKFFLKEYKPVVTSLRTNRYNGTNEVIADLNLRTLRDAARDTIRMSQNMINFLQKMVPTFNTEYQLKLTEMINNINEVIINFELELRKSNLDVREIIRYSMKTIINNLEPLKYFLFENGVTDEQEAENLKELAHYVVTGNVVIFRRFIRRNTF